MGSNVSRGRHSRWPVAPVGQLYLGARVNCPIWRRARVVLSLSLLFCMRACRVGTGEQGAAGGGCGWTEGVVELTHFELSAFVQRARARVQSDATVNVNLQGGGMRAAGAGRRAGSVDDTPPISHRSSPKAK
jgi:hypothetical protein